MLFRSLLVFIIVVRVPAWLMLLWWIGLQVLTGLPQLHTLRPEVSAGVAVWAHIGGFIAGAFLVHSFVDPHLVAERSAYRRATRGLWA